MPVVLMPVVQGLSLFAIGAIGDQTAQKKWFVLLPYR